MQSIARDSDEGSEEEFFDAQGRRAAPAAWGGSLGQMQRIVKGVKHLSLDCPWDLYLHCHRGQPRAWGENPE